MPSIIGHNLYSYFQYRKRVSSSTKIPLSTHTGGPLGYTIRWSNNNMHRCINNVTLYIPCPVRERNDFGHSSNEPRLSFPSKTFRNLPIGIWEDRNYLDFWFRQSLGCRTTTIVCPKPAFSLTGQSMESLQHYSTYTTKPYLFSTINTGNDTNNVYGPVNLT